MAALLDRNDRIGGFGQRDRYDGTARWGRRRPRRRHDGVEDIKLPRGTVIVVQVVKSASVMRRMRRVHFEKMDVDDG